MNHFLRRAGSLLLLLALLLTLLPTPLLTPTVSAADLSTDVYMLPCQVVNDAGNVRQNMSFIIRTRNGKIIVIDGGYSNDNLDPNYLISQLQSITGKEVPNVDAWFFTHNHGDHVGAFKAIAARMPTKLTISAVYYRFPTNEEIDKYALDEEKEDLKTSVRSFANHVAKMKQANGQPTQTVTLAARHVDRCNGVFNIDTVQIDVLMTCEEVFWGCDNITTKYSGDLTTNGKKYSSKTIKQLVNEDFGNNTTAVFRLSTMGQSVLFLGDAAEPEGIMLRYFHDKNAENKNKYFSLKSDIVQMAHHGQNAVAKNVYTAIAPKIALWCAPSWLYNASQSSTLTTYYTKQWMQELGTTNYVSKDGLQKVSIADARTTEVPAVPEDLKPFVFDATYYASKYADVKKAFGDDEAKLYTHFLKYGIEEGRCASPYFDIKYYLSQNSARMSDTYKGNYEKGLGHFLQYAYSEAELTAGGAKKLSPTFDCKYYYNNYPVLKELGLKNELEVLNYYVTTGKAAGHKPAAEVVTLNGGIVYHTVKNVAAVAPTCTAAGKTAGKNCATCGLVLTAQKEVTALGHSYDSGSVTTQPTCTAAGVKTYTCSVCKATKTEALSAKGHTEVIDKAVAATCTTAGKTEGSHCSVCNAVLVAQQTISATGHTEVLDVAVAPSLTESGLTEGKHCSVCNKVLLAQEEIPALGDGYLLLNPQLTKGGYWNSTQSSYYNTIIKNATNSANYCATVRFTKEQLPVGSILILESGWQYRPEGWVTDTVQTTREENTTAVYQVVTEEWWKDYTIRAFNIAKVGLPSLENVTEAELRTAFQIYVPKDAHTHNYTSTTTAATCEKAGSTAYYCPTCGHSYTKSIAAFGHSYSYKATKNPTTSASGTLTGTCSRCSGTKTVTLPKLTTTDYTKSTTKAATCTASGTDSYQWKTTTYGTFTFAATTAALGHSYTAKVTAPTCNAQGYTTHTCSRCSDSYKDTYVASTGHSWNSGVITTEATCTAAGVKTFTCSTCKTTRTESISAEGHTEVIDKAVAATCTTDGKTEGKHCSVCNEVIVAQEEIAALGHAEVIDKAVAPTCTETGLSEGKHCETCGEVLVARGILDALGHAPQYADNGNKTHTVTCENCDYSEIVSCTYENGECICGAKEVIAPIYDEAVKFSHSLTLENDISINFIGLGSALIGYDSFYLECKVPVYNGNELVGYETVTIEPVYNGKNYECTLLGITAKMMNDEIEAVFHMTKDGQEYYSRTDVYSVAEYAYGKLDSIKATDTAELKAICANLLRYGSMAQVQFNYRTDALVDTAMTDAHKAFLTDLSTVEMMDYRKQLSDLDTVIVPWKSTTLELGNKVIMCLIANLANYAGDPSELTMRLSYTDAKGVSVTEERPLALYNPEALTYAVSYDGLRATEMRSVVSAAIYRNGERVSKTVEYSIESYGARSKDPAMQELCRAMLAYGDSANAFFAN